MRGLRHSFRGLGDGVGVGARSMRLRQQGDREGLLHLFSPVRQRGTRSLRYASGGSMRRTRLYGRHVRRQLTTGFKAAAGDARRSASGSASVAGTSPISANLSIMSKEIRELGPPLARILRQLLRNRLPVSECGRERNRWLDRAFHLIPDELEVTPSAAWAILAPRRTPRGKWRSRGGSVSRPAAQPRACRTATLWHCRLSSDN